MLILQPVASGIGSASIKHSNPPSSRFSAEPIFRGYAFSWPGRFLQEIISKYSLVAMLARRDRVKLIQEIVNSLVESLVQVTIVLLESRQLSTVLIRVPRLKLS